MAQAMKIWLCPICPGPPARPCMPGREALLLADLRIHTICCALRSDLSLGHSGNLGHALNLAKADYPSACQHCEWLNEPAIDGAALAPALSQETGRIASPSWQISGG